MGDCLATVDMGRKLGAVPVGKEAVKIWLKIALNAVRLPKFEPVNGISWSRKKVMVKDLRQRSGLV